MTSADVQRTVDRALKTTGLSRKQRPKLLSDNGPCYISNELKNYINDRGMEHVRGRPNHPQTQGKIERYHRSMKNIIKLDNYYFPQQLKDRLAEFVDYYNNRRYHEALNNLRPVDVYFGRGEKILKQRKIIKLKTMKKRRKTHLSQVLIL
jgi:transposase InsO family protein